MHLFTCGVNYRTAELALRERMAFLSHEIPSSLQNLTHHFLVDEAVVLSTCNRTEIYCYGDDVGENLLDWFSDYKKIQRNTLSQHSYIYRGREAVRHLLRVANGLDSMVIGEAQVLGQVKTAYEHAHTAGTVGKALNQLFQFVLSTSKQIRRVTAIDQNSLSIAFLTVKWIREHYANLHDKTVLVIGSGETIELTLRYLHEHPLKQLLIANRTLEKAIPLANEFNAKAIAMGDLPFFLSQADIVISATACPYPIITRSTIELAKQQRENSPLLLVDLAVPRDVESSIEELEDVTLFTLDDLQKAIEQNRSERHAAAIAAEKMIDHFCDHYVKMHRALRAQKTIHAYRSHAEKLRDEQLQKALRDLANGDCAEEVLKRFAHQFTNKILHVPTINLRRAGYNDELDLLKAANSLFSLNSED